MNRLLPCFVGFFLLITQSLNGQPVNVMISDSNYINEPSIMLNPENPVQIVAGSNLNFYYFSDNSGLTWTRGTLASSFEVWGDPCIIADDSNNFYFFHLSNPSFGNWIDRIVCQKSTDGGRNWNDGSYSGLNGTKVQDKEWAIFDRKRKTIYMTWTQFDVYGPKTTPGTEDSSIILFSKSTDYGTSWSAPVRINTLAGDCWDGDKTVEGAVPAVGPKGEVYVCWASEQGLMFDRSFDGGQTWLANDIKIAGQPGGWDYDIPGINRCNGLPVIICDTGISMYNGNIYVNWTDQRNGTGNTDVWLIKSLDGGNNWSKPRKVNTDSGNNQQFFSWMSVDPFTGYIYVVFYDRRNYTDNQTDVYLAVSKDGGEHFSDYKISEAPFYPNSSVFFGDYINIVAYNNIIRPIWTRLDNGKHSIWTAIVDTQLFSTTLFQQKSVLVSKTAPNPSSEQTYFSFTLTAPQFASLWISDQTGKLNIPLFRNKLIPAGKYIQTINSRTLGIPSGIYYLVLITEDGTTTKKIVFINNH